jgi:hypothetical protein
VRDESELTVPRNIVFSIPTHPLLLSPDSVNLLPYTLLPLAGPEELSEEDTAKLLPDLQLLPPDKARDTDPEIIKVHLETLLLLTTTRLGRDTMRDAGVYPIIREAHLHVEDEGVREGAERLVDMLMRDEEDEKKAIENPHEDDEDNKVIELF